MNLVKKLKTFEYNDILKICDGTFFGKDSPVLPTGNMLMLDRIDHVSDEGGKYGKGCIIATLKIKPDLWFFKCHFKGDPVMPGCLGLDGMWQLMGFFLGWSGYKGKGRALGVKDLKFNGQVLPTNKVVKYIIDIKRVMDMRLTMLVADGTLEVDGEKIYTASDMRVGLFNT